MLLNPITLELASIARRPISYELTLRSALHLLDWLGCASYGLRSPQGKALQAHSKDAPEAKCMALGVGKRYVEQAAFHNGCLGNISEMEDLHRSSILNPGPVVIPAALALAEHINASGPQLLKAIITGYEVMIRIGQFLGPKHSAFFQTTSTAGSFGAAAACAVLLELSEQQTVWALGNAGSRTGGFWQMRHEECMSKSLHCGQAALAGLQAAMLAKRNFTGPAHILEGPQGFFKAIAPDANPVEIILDPDAPFRMLDVSFKPWPAGRHTHAAIDGALKIRAKLPADAEIAAISIGTYQEAVRSCDRPNPNTEAEARFSLQHAVAVALVKGKPGLDDFIPPFSNHKIAALRSRVALGADAALTQRYPQHYGAKVAVMLATGESQVAVIPDAKGDPAFPLSVSDLDQKFAALQLKAGLNGEQTLELSKAVKQLPDQKSLMEFSKVLARLLSR